MLLLLPAALFGACVLALPLAIHLLGRQRPPVQRVPSLRFVAATPLTPLRRSRLQDLVLLAVRMTILAVAVLAVARPTRPAPELAAVPGTADVPPAPGPIPVRLADAAVVAREAAAFTPAQIPFVAALLRDPSVAYAVRLGAAATDSHMPGVPLVLDDDGVVRLSAWADGSDTLRLATHRTASAAVRRLVMTVAAEAATVSATPLERADTAPNHVRRARDVHADTAPYARVLWGVVLALLTLEWFLRRRIVREPALGP